MIRRTRRPALARRSLLGLAVAAAACLLLAIASGCGSDGYTANNCGATLPLYDVRDGGGVPAARVTAANKGCVTLPGHATNIEAGAGH
jgi:hypothetical protein